MSIFSNYGGSGGLTIGGHSFDAFTGYATPLDLFHGAADNIVGQSHGVHVTPGDASLQLPKSQPRVSDDGSHVESGNPYTHDTTGDGARIEYLLDSLSKSRK
jgi:hypothetical protein